MKTRHHMCVNIEGLLRHYKRKKITFMIDDNGKKMTDGQARVELHNLQCDGWKVLPTADCEGFDKVKGCPGHKIEE